MYPIKRYKQTKSSFNEVFVIVVFLNDNFAAYF